MESEPVPIFEAIRIQGTIFSKKFLHQLSLMELPGLTPESYHYPTKDSLETFIQNSWNRLQIIWNAQQEETTKTKATINQEWLFSFFQELGYSQFRSSTEKNNSPISHFYESVPFHFMAGNELDASGIGFNKAYLVVQDYLNCSDEISWGFISEGFLLRLICSNVSLTRETFIEFDLAKIMNTKLYQDFRTLWLLCHQTRLETKTTQTQDCWLEHWLKYYQKTQLLPLLRRNVKEAIVTLGQGFLSHPKNQFLHEKIRNQQLTPKDYYQQLIVVFYRFLFLLITEDRQLLQQPTASEAEKEKYIEFYSTQMLRKLALNPDEHKIGNFWKNQILIFEYLSREEGASELALPGLGLSFWSSLNSCELNPCELSNETFLKAIQILTTSKEGNEQVSIDYQHMGIEILGNLYESLLELQPNFLFNNQFELKEREEGSYYPASVINRLLNSVLEPALRNEEKKLDTEKKVLKFKICDPACGSGYFLVAAAQRLAKHLAFISTKENFPTTEEIRIALRKVITRCVYGVDIDPLAIELCKFNLWLESFVAGKPLPFLNHHIQCGNSLVGATPALLKRGIPDEAFQPIVGDNKDLCEEYQKKNQEERKENSCPSKQTPPLEYLNNLSVYFEELEELSEETIQEVKEKEERFEDINRTHSYLYRRIWADAWCAVFVWKKTETNPPLITEALFQQLEKNPYSLTLEMMNEVRKLSEQYQFFHWHLAFPSVFRLPEEEELQNEFTGWTGGFDVILSDPPWEYTEKHKKHWLKTRRILKTGTQIPMEEDSSVLTIQCVEHFINSSKKYPSQSNESLIPYEVFVENNRLISTNTGKVGCFVPWTGEENVQNLMEKKSSSREETKTEKVVLFPID